MPHKLPHINFRFSGQCSVFNYFISSFHLSSPHSVQPDNEEDRILSSTTFFNTHTHNLIYEEKMVYPALFSWAGPQDHVAPHIFCLFIYTMSWEHIPALQRILQLDDILTVIITHYKKISESELIQWQTDHQQLMASIAAVNQDTLHKPLCYRKSQVESMGLMWASVSISFWPFQWDIVNTSDFCAQYVVVCLFLRWRWLKELTAHWGVGKHAFLPSVSGKDTQDLIKNKHRVIAVPEDDIFATGEIYLVVGLEIGVSS